MKTLPILRTLLSGHQLSNFPDFTDGEIVLLRSYRTCLKSWSKIGRDGIRKILQLSELRFIHSYTPENDKAKLPHFESKYRNWYDTAISECTAETFKGEWTLLITWRKQILKVSGSVKFNIYMNSNPHQKEATSGNHHLKNDD